MSTLSVLLPISGPRQMSSNLKHTGSYFRPFQTSYEFRMLINAGLQRHGANLAKGECVQRDCLASEGKG